MKDHGEAARERAHSFLSRHHYSEGEVGRKDGGPVSHAAVAAVKSKGLRLKSGGEVHGEKGGNRPDRRARGGEHEEPDADDKGRGGRKEHGKGKGHIGSVNIAIGNPEKEQLAHEQGMKEGAQMVAQKLAAAGAGGPPHPPMAGPPAGMPPPGAMPPRPMGAAHGGGIHGRDHRGRFTGGRI